MTTTIRVYNTLSKTKETLEPLIPGKVGIYLCGPTVYKPSHVGHMVGPVIFDTIKRFLAYCGYEVTLVINITDVDDKLISESNRRGISMAKLAEEMTADYMDNLSQMGVDSIDHFPKATENMDEIIQLTQTLIERGFAYQTEGDVYFDVGKDSEYGKLSRRSPENMQGAGGEMGQRKRATVDFALWKSAKPGEPSWESPWGPGRPGWHIECSAMSSSLLGETFDIHGGGLDLVFPHHENEIAQSECAHGKPQAKYWMHNGLMQASSEVGKIGGRATHALATEDQQAQEAGKMGKSKGAEPFRDLLQRHSPEVIRFFLLSTHYRSPIDFGDERIRSVAAGVDAFYRYFKRFQRATGKSFYEVDAPTLREKGEHDEGKIDPGDNVSSKQTVPLKQTLLEQVQRSRQRFLEAMDDDFNTGGAIGDLFELVKRLNKYIDQEGLEAANADADKVQTLIAGTEVLRELTRVLGLFRSPPLETDKEPDDELVAKLMQLIIDVRAGARKRKDFGTADQIRDALTDAGIVLEDRADGTEWTVKR